MPRKGSTEYTRQQILNLCMKDTGSGVMALALCNPDGSSLFSDGLSLNQSDSSGAVPVLILTQTDVSEPFTNYVGTSEAGVAKSLSSWTNATINGYIQIDISGSKKWIAYYNDPTS